jgi:phosphohistidine phosphatase
MQLYLIRHGIAAEREIYSNDEERPLIAEGIKKTEKVALRLQEIGVKFDIILTSPLVRAYQTAEILLKKGAGSHLELFSPLAPDGDFRELQEWLSSYREKRYNDGAKTVAAVGHQPDLGNWAELLIWGDIRDRLALKKSGVIGLDLPSQGDCVACSNLFLLTSPKWFV